MPDLIEGGREMQRFGVELRAELIDGNTLVGRAAVYGQLADVGPHYERIERRALDQVLADPATDVRALVNHDPAKLLGRQSAGTLRLRAADDGLHFEVDLPDTSYAHDLRALVTRGDMTGGSFGFIPGDDVWLRAPDGRRLRSHTQLRGLRDVSPVTFPAYDIDDIHLRSLDSFDGLDLNDFEIVVLEEPPDDEPDRPDAEPGEEPGETEPDLSHRSNNHSALIRARARIHLSTKEQQQ